MMPMALLAKMTPEKSAFFGEPATITMAASAPTTRLIGARMLPRTI
jgi:hypothetical protein